MPRAALPRSGDSGEAIIMLAAVGLASLFVVVQIASAIAFAPIMIGLYEQAGLELPSLLALAQTLGPLGVVVVLGALDAVVFLICVLAARKYWVGLLFAPPAIYMATTFALFLAFLGGSAATALVR
jgi:hypothetical protein